MPGTDPDSPSFKAFLRGLTTGRIRRLSGYRQGHFVPDSCNDASRAFVRRIGHEEVRKLAEGLHRDLRESFGFKRRELEYSCEEGLARIVSSLFEADLRIEQSSEDPDLYRMVVEVRGSNSPALADDARAHTCFNLHCDTVVVDFAGNLDVPAAIDQIEDIDTMRDALDYPAEADRFELRPPGLDLYIAVMAEQMTFQLVSSRDLARLMETSQKALDILAPAGLGLRIKGN